jgi:uroporphyrinogen-III synthase
MLVTRPEPDATDTAARLAALDIEPVKLPLFERKTLNTSLPDADGFAALALTSANALRALADRGMVARYQNIPVLTVGDHTAREALALGFKTVSSAGGHFGDLVEHIAHQNLQGPVLYPAGQQLTGDLAKSLAPLGIMVVTARVYDMPAITEIPQETLDEIEAAKLAAALFYSRRAAQTFAALTEALSAKGRSRLAVLCLSENVAAPLIANRFVRASLADYPSEEAMMALALSFARDQNAS